MLMWLIASAPLLLAAGPATPIQFEVPNGLLAIDANGASQLPFGYASPVRYQQVFDASQFTRVPAGGAFLTRIFPRADCSSTRSWLVTNLQVNLSTSLKTPDNLSAAFAENIGKDETLVFGPRNYIPPGSTNPTCPNPQFFGSGQELDLDTPFYYDPAGGNLLMDLRHSGNSWRFGIDPPLESHKLDAQAIQGDSVSRAAAFSLTENAAEVVDTTGLVIQLQFDPIPSLSVRYETNTLTIAFPLYPKVFVLQWSQTLGPGVVWVNYPGQIDQIGFDRFVKIADGSLQEPKFFRLACQSCRLPTQTSALNGSTVIEVEKDSR
jgi:hypothetical protein